MFSRIRRAAVATIIATATTVGALGVTALPAHAAAYEKACFVWSTGAVYRSQPAYLMEWTSGHWKSIRAGTTGSTGCIGFTSVPTGYYTTIEAYKVFGDANTGQAFWEGMPPKYATPGSQGVDLGTGRVDLVQCTQGLYGYCDGF